MTIEFVSIIEHRELVWVVLEERRRMEFNSRNGWYGQYSRTFPTAASPSSTSLTLLVGFGACASAMSCLILPLRTANFCVGLFPGS